MIDPLRGNSRTCDLTSGTCATLVDLDNVWGNGSTTNRQSVAVDAHYAAARTFDYFKNVHGRNGLFGNGTGTVSRVHYGNQYPYAFWDGTQMTYGDGLSNAKPLASLDVAAHELSHAVNDSILPPMTTGEAGGLREASSDIFGAMVEFYAANATDPGDYRPGDRTGINGDGSPVRHMYNPPLDGASHGCWSSSTKSLDVRYSSGVGNHFFFNLAEGSGATAYGTSPLCGSAPAVTGIGRLKAERIWYRALDVYFLAGTSYVNTANPANTARAGTLHATADLYGLCGVEYRAVQAAWTSVAVAGSDAPCSPGNNFTLTASPASGSVPVGGTLSTAVASALVSGVAESVALSASSATGVTAALVPATITSNGGTSTLTISTAAATAPGSYPVTVTGVSASVTRTVTFTLTVGSPLPGCSFTSGTDVAIVDLSTVESSITVTGCPGYANGYNPVDVHILHTYIGDLTVTLVAPDGSLYVLHNRTGGGTDNIHQSYILNLATELANGVWKLRVQDSAAGDVGKIDSWTIALQ
ncbi:hypothetical protein F4553_000294 [Allocatelliglobosispora scoriae]|uniref:Neutral metalloproteinase n=1 Tax=Allocatelliglobosispora scoriae TaxID=643052 RepID=A0A841BH07_9ACTN|nr:M4 family metallopeptidase [Allocatelliglobosispora scoriae]MBB5866915.1 hypothetical protein [Allocatelliglobosispora scoriae]